MLSKALSSVGKAHIASSNCLHRHGTCVLARLTENLAGGGGSWSMICSSTTEEATTRWSSRADVASSM
eukprot:2060914-Heterocapsa_arctica.AAC.1